MVTKNCYQDMYFIGPTSNHSKGHLRLKKVSCVQDTLIFNAVQTMSPVKGALLYVSEPNIGACIRRFDSICTYMMFYCTLSLLLCLRRNISFRLAMLL